MKYNIWDNNSIKLNQPVYIYIYIYSIGRVLLYCRYLCIVCYYTHECIGKINIYSNIYCVGKHWLNFFRYIDLDVSPWTNRLKLLKARWTRLLIWGTACCVYVYRDRIWTDSILIQGILKRKVWRDCDYNSSLLSLFF